MHRLTRHPKSPSNLNNHHTLINNLDHRTMTHLHQHNDPPQPATTESSPAKKTQHHQKATRGCNTPTGTNMESMYRDSTFAAISKSVSNRHPCRVLAPLFPGILLLSEGRL